MKTIFCEAGFFKDSIFSFDKYFASFYFFIDKESAEAQDNIKAYFLRVARCNNPGCSDKLIWGCSIEEAVKFCIENLKNDDEFQYGFIGQPIKEIKYYNNNNPKNKFQKIDLEINGIPIDVKSICSVYPEEYGIDGGFVSVSSEKDTEEQIRENIYKSGSSRIILTATWATNQQLLIGGFKDSKSLANSLQVSPGKSYSGGQVMSVRYDQMFGNLYEAYSNK